MVIENPKNKTNSDPITALINGKSIEVTEEEVALLFDFRLASKENRKKIKEFARKINE